MPLKVHGAFHSGLLIEAKNRLKPKIQMPTSIQVP